MIRDLRPAIELIKEFEGLRFHPYKDSAGVPTIGIGTIKYPNGKRVTMQDQPISEDDAIRFLEHHIKQDIDKLDNFIEKYKIEMNDNQYCALVCFGYNLGMGPVTTPGRSLCDAILSGEQGKVVEALKIYCKANVNGTLKTLNGLVRRRKAEAILYCS